MWMYRFMGHTHIYIHRHKHTHTHTHTHTSTLHACGKVARDFSYSPCFGTQGLSEGRVGLCFAPALHFLLAWLCMCVCVCMYQCLREGEKNNSTPVGALSKLKQTTKERRL